MMPWSVSVECNKEPNAISIEDVRRELRGGKDVY